MYKQPNHSFESSTSGRRLSSNNPFRPGNGSSDLLTDPASSRPTTTRNLSNNSVRSTNSQAFEDWVEKNKVLVDLSSDEEDTRYYMNPNQKDVDFAKPQFPPKPTRTGSDSSVNYGKERMSSNNPFASALNEPDSYVHHRDPPPPPSNGVSRNTRGAVSSPPPAKADTLAPPPSYEEVASPDREYPREKSSRQPSSSSRQHRSHSDTSRPHRSHKSSSGHHHDRERDRDRERRHHHHKSSRNKSPSKKKPEPVKSKNLDTIDKLDVTAFFGGGFHHDGPFDACTPHRNKNIKQAPVMAFPVDGPNNSIKGLAPTTKDDQMNLAFGTYDIDQNEIVNRKVSVKAPSTKVITKKLSHEDGSEENLANPLIKTNKQSNDPASTFYTPKQNPSVINFDANRTAEPVHGSTTAGLGSSTFLDGAPAPKINDDYLSPSNGGLGRKKSLVQRLRKNSASENSSRRNSHDSNLGRTQSPPSRPSFADEEINGNGGNSLLRRVKSLKVGGRK